MSQKLPADAYKKVLPLLVLSLVVIATVVLLQNSTLFNFSKATDDTAAVPLFGVIGNFQISSGRSYRWEQLRNGVKLYTDRDNYEFSLPLNLTPTRVTRNTRNVIYLRTANDDKNSTASSLLQFTALSEGTLYVGHDNRITPKPEWLTDFESVGSYSVPEAGTFTLYRKAVTAGTDVTLGGNLPTTAAASSNKFAHVSMYSVFLVPPAQTSPTPVTTAAGIEALSTTSGRAYRVAQMRSSAKLYTDRPDYEFSLPLSQPPITRTTPAWYIMTPNNDKNSTASALMQFTLSGAGTVYVGHDRRVTVKPSWLNDFEKVGAYTVTEAGTFDVYKKDVTQGASLNLGGNLAATASASSNKFAHVSMYSVFFLPTQ